MKNLKAKLSNRALKKLAIAGSAIPFAVMSTASHAAGETGFDVTAVVAQISSATTGLTTVQGAFLTLSITVLAGGLVLAYVKRRAGA